MRFLVDMNLMPEVGRLGTAWSASSTPAPNTDPARHPLMLVFIDAKRLDNALYFKSD